jgi:hypothetical protein
MDGSKYPDKVRSCGIIGGMLVCNRICAACPVPTTINALEAEETVFEHEQDCEDCNAEGEVCPEWLRLKAKAGEKRQDALHALNHNEEGR